jgi:hypothetical protein
VLKTFQQEVSQEHEKPEKHAERADHGEHDRLMGLRERKAGNEQDRADRIDQKVGGGELAIGERRECPVEQPEQHHRGEAHKIGVRMHRRELEALVDADPNAEGEAENAEEQSNQNKPAVDILHAEILPQIAPRPTRAAARPLAKSCSGRHKRARASHHLG